MTHTHRYKHRHTHTHNYAHTSYTYAHAHANAYGVSVCIYVYKSILCAHPGMFGQWENTRVWCVDWRVPAEFKLARAMSRTCWGNLITFWPCASACLLIEMFSAIRGTSSTRLRITTRRYGFHAQQTLYSFQSSQLPWCSSKSWVGARLSVPILEAERRWSADPQSWLSQSSAPSFAGPKTSSLQVVNIPNSMTVLPELLPYAVEMALRRLAPRQISFVSVGMGQSANPKLEHPITRDLGMDWTRGLQYLVHHILEDLNLFTTYFGGQQGSTHDL